MKICYTALLLLLFSNLLIFVDCDWSIRKMFSKESESGGTVNEKFHKGKLKNLTDTNNDYLFFNNNDNDDETGEECGYFYFDKVLLPKRYKTNKKILKKAIKSRMHFQTELIPPSINNNDYEILFKPVKINRKYFEKYKKIGNKTRNLKMKAFKKDHKHIISKLKNYSDKNNIKTSGSLNKNKGKNFDDNDDYDEEDNTDCKTIIEALKSLSDYANDNYIYNNDDYDYDDESKCKLKRKELKKRKRLLLRNLYRSKERRSKNSSIFPKSKGITKIELINETLRTTTSNLLKVNGTLEGVLVMSINFTDLEKNNENNIQNRNKMKTRFNKIATSTNKNNYYDPNLSSYELYEVESVLNMSPIKHHKTHHCNFSKQKKKEVKN